MALHPIQGGVEIFLVTSCYRNWDKLQPGVPLNSYTDLTYPLQFVLIFFILMHLCSFTVYDFLFGVFLS